MPFDVSSQSAFWNESKQTDLLLLLLLLLFIRGFFLRLSFICLLVCFFSLVSETVSYNLIMLVNYNCYSQFCEGILKLLYMK